ncbi:hypothetical protein ACJZ2D_012443 [Fusarium nematophilum]
MIQVSFQPVFTHYPNTGIRTGVTQWGNLNGPWPEPAKFCLAARDWVSVRPLLSTSTATRPGGHYPAVAETYLWVDDVRAFLSGL